MPENLPDIDELNKGLSLDEDLPSIDDLNGGLKKKAPLEVPRSDSYKPVEPFSVAPKASESVTPSTLNHETPLQPSADIGIQPGETTSQPSQQGRNLKTVEQIKKEGGKPSFENYVASALGYVGEHAGSAIEGAVDVAKGIKKGFTPPSQEEIQKPVSQLLKQSVGEGLDLLKNTAKTAFETISLTPPGAAFNVAAEHLPEDFNKWLFSPAHKIAEKLGYTPKEGDLGAKALDVADIVGSLLFMKGAEVTAKAELGINKEMYDSVKEKIKKKEPLNTDEFKIVAEVVNTTTTSELAEAVADNKAKLKPQFSDENKVVDVIEKAKEGENINKDIASLPIGQSKFNQVVDIAKEGQHIDEDQAITLKKNFEDIQKAKESIPEEHKDNAEVVSLIAEKNALEETKKTVDESFHPEINTKIKDLKTKVQEIANPKENGTRTETAMANKKAKTKASTEAEPVRVLTPKDEQVKRTEFVQTKTKELQALPNEEYVKNFIDEGHLNSINGNRDFGMRPDFNLPTADIKKGIEDIKNNKESAASRHLKEAILKTKETGKIPMIEGTGGMNRKIDVPFAEFHEESKQHDDYFNSLTEEQKQQEYENAIQPVNAIREGNANERNKKITNEEVADQLRGRIGEAQKDAGYSETNGRRVDRKIDDKIIKLKAELAERNKGKLRSGPGLENLDIYTELAYLHIKKGIKTVAEFAKELGETVHETIEKAWAAATKQHENEGVSGIKKALVPEEKIETTELNKRSKEDVYERGKELVDNGDINPQSIVDEINKKPRALQPDEVAALVYYKAKLDKTFDSLTDKIEKAKEDKDIDKEALLRTQLNGLDNDMNAYHEMALKTAYEQSLAFRLRQLLVDSEYNLKTQERKYKAINNGELPPDVAAKFKAYDEELKIINKKLRDLEKQRDEAVEQNKKSDAEREAELAAREERKKARASSKEKIVSERKVIISDIKEKLRKARGELNVVPIPYAKELAIIAPDVAKLMRNYAQEGIVKLDDFVDNIHNDLKDLVDGLSKKDVLNIIAGNYKEPRTRNEVSERLSEIRKKAKLITRLETLEKGEKIEKQEKVKKQESEELSQIKKEIGEHDLTRLEQLKSRYKTDISKYEEKLKKGDFTEKVQKEKPPIDEEMRKLENERNAIKHKFDTEQEKARLNNRPLSQKIRDNFIDAINLPKSLMASADMSAPLRQGAILSFRHPIIASKSAVEMFKQAFSEKKATEWLNNLRSSPEYSDIKKADLYVSEPTAKLSAKEEQFISNIAKKIPIWGHIVNGSERAYVGYLNKLRVDVFSQFHDALKQSGIQGEEMNKELKGFAEFVNNATGRGHLGRFEDAAPLLNGIFFSPRYIASRFNLLRPGKYIEMPKRTRIEALKTMGIFLGTVSTVLALAKAGGAEVETDPRSPDFAKIKIGNTRIDLLAGFQQISRLIATVVSGERKNSEGEIVKLGEGYKADTRFDVVERFGRSKLGPAAGTSVDVLQGKDFAGNDITVKDEILKNILPLWSSDIKDLYKEQGVVAGTAESLLNFFGAGVQYYTPNQKGHQATYKEKYYEPIGSAKSR